MCRSRERAARAAFDSAARIAQPDLRVLHETLAARRANGRLRLNADGELHITDVLTDRFRIVTDAVRNIKPRISSDALATLPPHKTVQ